MSHFRSTPDGIEVSLTPEERVFLADVLPLLAGLGSPEDDPGAARLKVPVYLDDPGANDEWWRLVGEDLTAARSADRSAYQRAIGEQPVVLSDEDANAVLRVINEARLVLGARMGVEVEDDHDKLPEDSRQVLDYLSWIQEELIVELTRAI